MRKFLATVAIMGTVLIAKADTGHDLWLRPYPANKVNISCDKNSPTIEIAKQELIAGWRGLSNATIKLIIKKDKGIAGDGYQLSANSIQANTDVGILYGVYDLLRRQQTGEGISNEVCNPSYHVRILNHWDNPDGSIERGYAGKSIFWRKDDPFTVTENDKKLWQEYARANASIGINASVLDNVNASPLMLTADYLNRVKAIAEVFRPYGIKTYLSVKFSSPKQIGGLTTNDPLDPAVAAWWKQKVKEVYGIIPDFGGFLIKANSEGQPGPQDYNRTHADGANMLADALKPYGGIVMWRAFVYQANDKDRAKQAYTEFMPLDGQFRDNVIIQVKNGPVDFMPREPFSPLFGAMKKTPVMAELQITQEYLGHSTHLVFLAPMWEECLQSDTYQKGQGSTVAKVTDGSIYPQKITAMAGVANIGLDTNWCGHHFAQANWYAFGRLAWNNKLTSEQIAEEWLKLSFGSADEGVNAVNWQHNFLAPVKQMMIDSREAAVNYMMPLGFHHIMSANEHYGPGPWWAPPRMRPDWTPPYYHQADSNGVGFNRTKTGSDAVSQYHEPLATLYNDPKTCPDGFLLWFHHLPWSFTLKSGKNLWDEICYKYDTGVQQVRQFQKVWDKAEAYVDAERFAAVQRKLRSQSSNAVLWKDACLLYFQRFSKMPIPYDIERPVNNLDEIIANDTRRRR
jgi:alpha-glucuronidase